MNEYNDYNDYNLNNGFYNQPYNQSYNVPYSKDLTPEEQPLTAKTKVHETKKTVNAKPNRNKHIAKRFVAVALSAALFGGVAGGVFNAVSGDRIRELRKTYDMTEQKQSSGDELFGATSSSVENEVVSETMDPNFSISTVEVAADNTSKNMGYDVSDIANSVMPSIVSVTVKGVQEVPDFFGYVKEYETEGCGSGIVIGENESELLVVTNNHVVENAKEVSVSFIDESVYEAKVKATDSDNDLAIISVPRDALSEETRNAIKIAKLGNSDELKVGEQVVAIGNALGYGQSVTTGIVSAKNCMNSTNATPLIQTDAAINPGNSGGALLNMNGEVIGINSSKYASTEIEGMGFAIPISSVESIISDLMTQTPREKVEDEKRGYLGIQCGTISVDAASMYGIPEGVLVIDIIKPSGAGKAGLKKNDVITKINGKTVKSADALIEELSYYEKGETVTVTYQTLEDDEYIEKEAEVVLLPKAED